MTPSPEYAWAAWHLFHGLDYRTVSEDKRQAEVSFANKIRLPGATIEECLEVMGRNGWRIIRVRITAVEEGEET